MPNRVDRESLIFPSAVVSLAWSVYSGWSPLPAGPPETRLLQFHFRRDHVRAFS